MDNETFRGFTKGALALLAQLPERDRDWFAAHRDEYRSQVWGPARAFVVAMGAALVPTFGLGLQAVPGGNGSIAPIHNDRRFAPGLPTYRDHLTFRFWEGSPKLVAPTLMVRVHAQAIGFGAGTNLDADGVARWREAVASPQGEALAVAVQGMVRGYGAEVAGPALRTVPRPYPPDHPRADLLRHRGLWVRWQEPVPAAVGSARFVRWCATRLARAQPLHAWLREHLGP